jgi:hypothetical protein
MQSHKTKRKTWFMKVEEHAAEWKDGSFQATVRPAAGGRIMPSHHHLRVLVLASSPFAGVAVGVVAFQARKDSARRRTEARAARTKMKTAGPVLASIPGRAGQNERESAGLTPCLI